MHVISVNEMRRLDAAAIAAGVSGEQLMFNAGAHAAEEILRFVERYPLRHRQSFTILAGKGNNGGDAWVVADVLMQKGHRVALFSTCPIAQLPEAAAYHASKLPTEASVTFLADAEQGLPAAALAPGTIVIDGLLGTGLRGEPTGIYARLIAQVNASGLPVIALDIPSGLNGDTGNGDLAITADLTVTMAYPKIGLLTGAGPQHCGLIRVVDIGLPEPVADTAAPIAAAFAEADARGFLARRPFHAHKNTFGHVLCVAGARQYPGAPFLAGEAALRSGAGLVTVAVPAGVACPPHAKALIVAKIGSEHDAVFSANLLPAVQELLTGKNALLYGPGTGRDPGPDLLRLLLAAQRPIVIDADGLRLLAAHPELLTHDKASAPVILTPHPGEMAALLTGFQLTELLHEPRPEQAKALAAATGAIVVLKGQGTIIAAPGAALPTYNLSGSPALATAGTGDVLAGMIAAFLAQGLAPVNAAALAVFVHGHAADLAPAPQRGLIADDLLALIPTAMADLNPLA
ncbi:MAG: NAD(P)H-hydrate dehydratase [Lentisphaerae bacterium]|jgi:hydroxyethylthiazole kinase-like uncharacterized protein yjeF|nr:NAD(P)H-hydrate dehydratase [Lentisphaerota bacterium]